MSNARAIAFASLAASAAVALGLSLGPTSEQGWLLATRFTARLSFPIFLCAFSASALARLAPSDFTRGLLRSRRAVGLAFATAHTIHLGALTIYFAVSGAQPSPVALVGGGATYLAIFAMAATSNDAAVRRLGRSWSRLHTAGAYLVWLIFLQSYAGRVASGKPFFVPQVVLAVTALGLRIAARRQRSVAQARAAGARAVS
jgi:DMSO/TMAO reductase YedYZ heme-binding membrane subunit